MFRFAGVYVYCFMLLGIHHTAVFNDLYISTNKCLPLMKCFDNNVSANLKRPSLGEEIFFVNSHMNIHTTELRELNKYKTTLSNMLWCLYEILVVLFSVPYFYTTTHRDYYRQ